MTYRLALVLVAFSLFNATPGWGQGSALTEASLEPTVIPAGPTALVEATAVGYCGPALSAWRSWERPAVLPVLGAQSLTTDETVRSAQRMLERLPYYGVFDYIVFRVDSGTVFLGGYSFQAGLRSDAATAARRASGVDEVANKIEVLPPSQNDDRIRWATFYRIYSDDFLSRYAPGGVHRVVQELKDERNFPGMQPIGLYPIHIVVRNGRTKLFGVVDNAGDRQLAEVRAREVTGVFEVENNLAVAP